MKRRKVLRHLWKGGKVQRRIRGGKKLKNPKQKQAAQEEKEGGDRIINSSMTGKRNSTKRERRAKGQK